MDASKKVLSNENKFMPVKITTSFNDLVMKVGSIERLAALMNCHPETIRRWRLYKIPLKYRDPLVALKLLTIQEFDKINQAIRESISSKSPSK